MLLLLILYVIIILFMFKYKYTYTFISTGLLSSWLAWMLLIVSSQYQYLTREPVIEWL